MSVPPAVITSWSSLTKHLDCVKASDYASYSLVYQTAWYVWQCHKLGILCVVTADGPKIWPFSNPSFNNQVSWPKRPEELRYILDGQVMSSWQEYYALKKQRYRIKETINPDTSKWWLNGHLLCNTTDAWGTRGLLTIQSTLDYLFQTRSLEKYLDNGSSGSGPSNGSGGPEGANGPNDGTGSDTFKPYAFLINRRDFPQLTSDSTKTAHTAFVPRRTDGSLLVDKWPNEVPMYYNQAKAKMLSFYGSDFFQDRVWQPPEYWLANIEFVKFQAAAAAAAAPDKLMQTGVPQTPQAPQAPQAPFAGQGRAALKASLGSKWPQGPKIPKAVFRGTLTGLYMDLRNVRLRLVKESMANPEKLDAGLTAWSPRDRISTDSDGLTTVSYQGLPDWLTFAEPMTPWAQAHYDTIIYVPGHVASSRMYWHLECQKACGCQIQVLDDSSCVANIINVDKK